MMCSFSPSKSSMALHASLGSKRPRSGVNVSVLTGALGSWVTSKLASRLRWKHCHLAQRGTPASWDGMADSSRVGMMGLKSSTIIHHNQSSTALQVPLPNFQLPWPCGWESRRKAASPRSINNAHQLPGASSRLTPLELDANLQASASWGVRARAAVPPWHWCYWYFLTCWSCRKNGRQMEEDVPAENAGFPCPCMVVSCCFQMFPVE